MPRKVKANIGDSLCNIAFKNGFGDCKPLREEPANAFIVNRADDPGQILPGDIGGDGLAGGGLRGGQKFE